MSAIQLSPQLTSDQQQQLRTLIANYRDCYAFTLKEIGTTSRVVADPVAEGPPIYSLPYPRGPVEESLLQKEVDKLLHAGIVKEGESPWASPAILVKKADGTYRLVIDFRKVNERIQIKDVPILP